MTDCESFSKGRWVVENRDVPNDIPIFVLFISLKELLRSDTPDIVAYECMPV